MHAKTSFDYAVLRVVPRVDRGEFVNAGVVLFCLERDFLGARVECDDACWRALCPDVDVELVKAHLEAYPRICEGSYDGGPIAKLSRRQRFHLLAAPRSTVVQVSPVHTGITDEPEQTLDNLFIRLVARGR